MEYKELVSLLEHPAFIELNKENVSVMEGYMQTALNLNVSQEERNVALYKYQAYKEILSVPELQVEKLKEEHAKNKK